jgi:hypothetical protein
MADSASVAHEPDRRAFGRGLLILTAAGLLVRIAFLLLEPATRPVADERTWTNWAVENLVTPKVRFSPLRTHMIFHPPVYPYFIAVLYELTGTLAAVKWAQAVVGSLLIPAVGRAGGRALGPRAGLIAAGITAFYPELIWFSAHFWCETLFMVFLWWAVERLLAAHALESRGAAAAAGLLWSLAILTRETVFYLTPLAALWLGWRRGRPGWQRAALFLAVAVTTVAPWTWRNWTVFRAFVPVSTAGGLALYQGNTPLSREEVYQDVDAVRGRIEQYRYARATGFHWILERQPWWLLEKLRDEMPNFWEADSLALIHVKRGAYGNVPPAAAVAAGLVVILPYLAVLGMFVLGLASLRVDRPRLLLVGLLALYNLLHVATHGFARYRMPVLPVVFLLASAAYLSWREGRRGLSPRRRAAAVLLAVAFGVTLYPSVRRNLSHPAFGFTDQGDPEAQTAPLP